MSDSSKKRVIVNKKEVIYKEFFKKYFITLLYFLSRFF